MSDVPSAPGATFTRAARKATHWANADDRGEAAGLRMRDWSPAHPRRELRHVGQVGRDGVTPDRNPCSAGRVVPGEGMNERLRAARGGVVARVPRSARRRTRAVARPRAGAFLCARRPVRRAACRRAPAERRSRRRQMPRGRRNHRWPFCAVCSHRPPAAFAGSMRNSRARLGARWMCTIRVPPPCGCLSSASGCSPSA